MAFVFATVGWSLVLRHSVPSPETRWIESLYETKEAIATKMPNPRVFLIGGSATLYSISAARLSRETGFNVINFGTHAGLGPEYIVHRAEAVLKSGDTAIFMPEYEQQQKSSVTVLNGAQVLYNDPLSIWEMNISHFLPFLFSVNPILYVQHREMNALPNQPPPVAHLDGWGDETSNDGSTAPVARDQILAEPGGVGIILSAGSHHDVFDGFVAWCKEHGVKLLHASPPVFIPPDQRPATLASGGFEAINAYFSSLNVSNIGNGRDYMLDIDDMFNTKYHANDAGRIKVTKRLSEDLCKVLSCPARENRAEAQPTASP